MLILIDIVILTVKLFYEFYEWEDGLIECNRTRLKAVSVYFIIIQEDSNIYYQIAPIHSYLLFLYQILTCFFNDWRQIYLVCNLFLYPLDLIFDRGRRSFIFTCNNGLIFFYFFIFMIEILAIILFYCYYS